MNDYELMPEGTQVVYVPTHAHGDMAHKDCERGWVQRDEGKRVLCRFFRRNGERLLLRTLANGEFCSRDSLVVQDYIDQKAIRDAQEQINMALGIAA
jgi:hypothetical protein